MCHTSNNTWFLICIVVTICWILYVVCELEEPNSCDRDRVVTDGILGTEEDEINLLRDIEVNYVFLIIFGWSEG